VATLLESEEDVAPVVAFVGDEVGEEWDQALLEAAPVVGAGGALLEEGGEGLGRGLEVLLQRFPIRFLGGLE